MAAKVRCEYCPKSFPHRNLSYHNHVLRCKKKRKSQTKDRVCQYCKNSMRDSIYAKHLENCKTSYYLLGPPKNDEPKFVQGGLPSLGKRKP
jgi:hypothetical protein